MEGGHNNRVVQKGVWCANNEKESVSMGVVVRGKWGEEEEEEKEEEREEEEEGECQHEAGEEVTYQLQK